MRFQFLLFAVLFAASSFFGQQTNRQFEGIELTQQGAQIKVSDGIYLIAPLTDKIIQTTFFPPPFKR